MVFSAEQIEKNWEKHLKIVNTFITGDRKDKLLSLYESLAETMILAPASGKPSFHNAFPGGYIDHVNRVVHCALKTKALWEEMGATIDFTDEELVFAALNHDLGKIGFKDQPNYLPQTDAWRRDKLGEVYVHNKDLSFMLIQRHVFLPIICKNFSWQFLLLFYSNCFSLLLFQKSFVFFQERKSHVILFLFRVFFRESQRISLNFLWQKSSL